MWRRERILDLLEGIRSRRSIRNFNSKPVSEKVLIQLLELAIQAPSGVNRQPWEFFVVRGEVLEEFRRKSLENYRLGVRPNPEIPLGSTRDISPVLEGVFRERQVELAKQIFQLLGIEKGNKKKQREWNEKMLQFYDAPAVIIVVVDKMLHNDWPILDIGFVCQNIVLAGQEYGLGTCVMRAIVDYPEHIRKIVGIPESKRIIIGIAIGYPNWNHPINRLRTNRERIDKIVTLVG
jgi:nitroreductase